MTVFCTAGCAIVPLDRVVELADDRIGRARGREDPEPGPGHVVEPLFADGRNVRERY